MGFTTKKKARKGTTGKKFPKKDKKGNLKPTKRMRY